ncbi:MAG TPA: XRE family transcriptional regulator [Providencia sp.]|uniref:helix-turn-helix domain-containing protein n=1 Tax=Providencia sp. TaxID=589 RepID=UPI000E872E67|nr:helix-turn-helix transcriptional regulator [Providencia sp.]MBP6082684.1 helix-turn-helix transcriptional regulator [Providencia sp.]HBO22411.1 XRE family transcriptional regulator [Providencia sp.]
MNNEIISSFSVLNDRYVMKNIIARNVGTKIRNLRQKYKISGLELANVIGVSQQQVSKYEKGLVDISISKIMLISIYFNVNVEYFFNK